MLDTVPGGVQLTDVITPLPVKPANVILTLDGDTLKLFGQVRVRDNNETIPIPLLIFSSSGI